MNRKIEWKSHELDEIELVYQKAEKNSQVGALLEQLESQALDEAKANVGILKTGDGTSLTSEQFDRLGDIDKETIIKVLGNYGLKNLNFDIESKRIIVQLSNLITKVQACTFFSIINRIEKLDGSLSLLAPKWTLELQIPLEGKKGIMQWELLLMKLYPWISICETSTNEVAVTTAPISEEKKPNVLDMFAEKMSRYPVFMESLALAKEELKKAIQEQPLFMPEWKDNLSTAAWDCLDDEEKFIKVLSMGFFSIIFRNVVCVDFSEHVPNCIAIALLYTADSGMKSNQLVDAGDRSNPAKLIFALNKLHGCCENWECTIANPVFVKIGSESKEDHPNVSEPVQKKTFWQRIFGSK